MYAYKSWYLYCNPSTKMNVLFKIKFHDSMMLIVENENKFKKGNF